MPNLKTFDLSTGAFVNPTGYTGETATITTPISPTPAILNTPAAFTPSTANAVASSEKVDPAKTSSGSKVETGFSDTNHLNNFIKVTIGELQYNSNAGQVLKKRGTPVICISSYMHSYAEIILNDPNDSYRQELSKKVSEEVNIEIGFLGAETETKLTGKLYEVGRVLPDGTWLMVVDLSYEMNNNTSPSVQFSGNAQSEVADTTTTATINTLKGVISFYGGTDGFDGKQTASGEIFNSSKLTAAHPSLPFGTQVVVTNLVNGKKVTVTVNDRGPYTGGRIMDISRGAAIAIGLVSSGTTQASLEVQGKVKNTNASGSNVLGNSGKPANEKPTPTNQPVTGTGLTPADLSTLIGSAATADKGATPAVEIFTAQTSNLKFAKDTAFATGKAGSVRLQQSMLAFSQQQALLQGDVIVTRGNTVHQVSATGGDSSGITIDYVKNRACFRRDPKLWKRTGIHLQSGYGALSVVGYNIDGKQSVGATVVTPGAATIPNPATIANVPEWGQIKLGDRIPGSRFTWSDATRGGERIPSSKQIMQAIVAIAAEMAKIEATYGRVELTSWYRDPATNIRVSSSGAHDKAHHRFSRRLFPQWGELR